MNLVAAILAVLVFQGAGVVLAQDTDHASHHPVTAKPEAADILNDGEVRKVDRDAKKITIRHGALPALDMPTPMTMVYGVKDPAMLDQVKAGDKVRFAAEKISGQFTVVRIEPVK